MQGWNTALTADQAQFLLTLGLLNDEIESQYEYDKKLLDQASLEGGV